MNKAVSVAVDKFFWKGMQSVGCKKLGYMCDTSSAGSTMRKVGHFEHMKERGVLNFIRNSSHFFSTRQDRQCILPFSHFTCSLYNLHKG